MAIVVGENSYVTEQELLDYAAAREITVSGTPEVLLIKAMDWLELRSYKGTKTEETQDLEFPRNGDTEVPKAIKTAQVITAILIDQGEDFWGVVEPAIKSERIEGAIDIEYQEGGASSNRYPQLDNLLSPYLVNTGMNIRLVR
jgi:hypothetical protein